jgi:hypothetical protein
LRIYFYISIFAVYKGGEATPKNATITLRIEGEINYHAASCGEYIPLRLISNYISA